MISWPEQLVDALAKRRALIQIGSGVSANALAASGKRPPTWRDFLSKGLNKCGYNKRHIQRALGSGDLLRACEFIKLRLGEDWFELLRQEFSDPNYKHALIHEAIYNIDPRIVISTNFDRIYENYAISASEQTVVVKHHTDDDVGMLIYGNDRYVIKLHGSIDSPTKMIFTESDYASARSRYRTFYNLVDALISTNICLLVGSGLQDPDVRMLFEDYRFRTPNVPHYIVLPNPIHQDEIAIVRNTRGLNVLLYSPRDHHKELTESLVELAARVDSRRVEVADEQSW